MTTLGPGRAPTSSEPAIAGRARALPAPPALAKIQSMDIEPRYGPLTADGMTHLLEQVDASPTKADNADRQAAKRVLSAFGEFVSGVEQEGLGQGRVGRWQPGALYGSLALIATHWGPRAVVVRCEACRSEDYPHLVVLEWDVVRLLDVRPPADHPAILRLLRAVDRIAGGSVRIASQARPKLPATDYWRFMKAGFLEQLHANIRAFLMSTQSSSAAQG